MQSVTYICNRRIPLSPKTYFLILFVWFGLYADFNIFLVISAVGLTCFPE